MPESRTRHKHAHHHAPSHQPHTTVKTKRSAAAVVAILVAILGLAIAFFTQGRDVFWMIFGTASGALLGYFVGHNMDKAISKK